MVYIISNAHCINSAAMQEKHRSQIILVRTFARPAAQHASLQTTAQYMYSLAAATPSAKLSFSSSMQLNLVADNTLLSLTDASSKSCGPKLATMYPWAQADE